MKKFLLSIFLLILFTGCRSLGSWYGLKPPPQSVLSVHELKDGYLVSRISFKGIMYDTVLIDPSIVKLKTVAAESTEGIRFADIADDDLIFAVNGGIFKEDMTPLGLYINEGELISPLNRREGYGNFYLKPNGILLFKGKEPSIEETESFATVFEETQLELDLAVQSGPLLLYDGKINQAFTPGSRNRYVRTGVGLSHIFGDKKLLIFAISNRPVNFHDFASFFKEIASCSDALYLDGHIAAMNIPELPRRQTGRSYATILYSTK